MKPMKEGFEKMETMRNYTSDIKKLKEKFHDSNKSHMKIIEEVSPEISEILVKLDKPASQLELGLERIQGLGFSQQEDAMEQLPVTLKIQVEHWSTTRDSRILEKMGVLVQAVDRIKHIMCRVKFST